MEIYAGAFCTLVKPRHNWPSKSSGAKKDAKASSLLDTTLKSASHGCDGSPRRNLHHRRPKTSEAAARGNTASTTCFLDVFALTSVRHARCSGAMPHNSMRTTLPKTNPGALSSSHHTILFYMVLTLVTLLKTIAFGKVRDGASTRSCPP